MNKFPSIDYDENTFKVIKPVEFSEEDSYNLRYLKILKKKRQFRSYLCDVLEVDGDTLSKLAIYKNLNFFTANLGTITWQQIFILREKLPPAGWFYKYNEELPEIIEYNNLHKEFTADLYSKKTLGHLKLREVIKELTYAGLAEKSGISVSNLKNMMRLIKSANGYIKYHTLPSVNIINQLKPFVNEQLWFIMEDEKK